MNEANDIGQFFDGYHALELAAGELQVINASLQGLPHHHQQGQQCDERNQGKLEGKAHLAHQDDTGDEKKNQFHSLEFPQM
ncbi:hypothetical protein [Acidovorax sp.]|uniref:hypothetical protein n=1 Tax=Acidovorax sp. TaxID=1872122 RepID=UPI0025C023C5|nr:hypothetical protein [Acidovorax sp.]